MNLYTYNHHPDQDREHSHSPRRFPSLFQAIPTLPKAAKDPSIAAGGSGVLELCGHGARQRSWAGLLLLSLTPAGSARMQAPQLQAEQTLHTFLLSCRGAFGVCLATLSMGSRTAVVSAGFLVVSPNVSSCRTNQNASNSPSQDFAGRAVPRISHPTQRCPGWQVVPPSMISGGSGSGPRAFHR